MLEPELGGLHPNQLAQGQGLARKLPPGRARTCRLGASAPLRSTSRMASARAR
ncbi:hypothetical protein [Thermus thermophilus]|uniref:hypothetical protein n=1 Tax=Thermus thermophilus TaxID=274 RepID=UPI003BAA5711